ncbi:MAG: 2-C-methyl-D-erythritol 4-phosphate cytidylyltransferase, partial [Microbacteriaceae bacterium]|nr:2-C-methyl-D-erythritol 4-phosphate cytidylyltransferase [Microbacteriaceae bacterium]
MAGPEVAVVVVAAGSGARLGRAEPKAFVRLGERSLLEHALSGIAGMREAVAIVVVAPETHLGAAREAAPGAVVVAGGPT